MAGPQGRKGPAAVDRGEGCSPGNATDGHRFPLRKQGASIQSSTQQRFIEPSGEEQDCKVGSLMGHGLKSL